MNDQKPEMSPEQAREVRRLLADARHTEPIPTDVADRLDRVLAELATQTVPTHDEGAPASVVALASRRRRRFTRLLVAAAAVVAVGFGINQLGHAIVSPSSSSDSASSTAGGSAAQEGAPHAARSHKAHDNAPNATSDRLRDGNSLASVPKHAPRIRPAHFAEDVTRARDVSHPSAYSYSAQEGTIRAARGCDSAHWGKGTAVPVRYDGNLAVLLFRAPRGDTQVVDLFGCESLDVLRSITLDAP